ncbi:MAG: hypothetical protein AB8H47_23425 [Bacteroidia bacterium]
MDELLLKYSRLSRFSQKQLLDFLDFLLGKQAKKDSIFNLNSYQNKLMQVSTWSEADIEEMNDNAKSISWETEKW